MIRFTSLTIENFGPFKGNQTIDFTSENGVTIIWGDNGRGKTTLLNILRYALFGHYKNRQGTNVNLTTLSNIESRDDGDFNFKVVLKILSDGIRYELTRQCSVREGIPTPQSNDDYETIVYLKKNGSFLGPETIEHTLKTIMPDEVSRFFLFDGELLQEYEELLKEGTEVGAKIKESIEKILGVPVLTNSAIDTQAVLDDYKGRRHKIAQSKTQTQKIANKLEGLEAEKREQTAEKERLQKDLSEQESEYSCLEDYMKHNNYVRTLLERMDVLNTNINKWKAERDSLITHIVTLTKDAWTGLVSDRIETILSDITLQIDAIEKKETSYAIEKRIVDDMMKVAQNRHCHLCNQSVDEIHAQAILNRISAYETSNGLNTKEKEYLQHLRLRETILKGMRGLSNVAVLRVYESKLAEVEVSIDDSEQGLKAIKEQLERHGNVQELNRDMDSSIFAMTQCLKKIDNLKDGIQKTKDKIKDIEQAMKTLEDKMNQASTDAELILAGTKVSLCEQIHSIFEKGIAAYRDKLKTDVEKDATELFLEISNDPDYEKLQINENYGLEIVHVSGELVPLRSAGFEHVVALSLIGALHKNAPLRGPIIMDSPFGRLDQDHKNNIVKALPIMSDQIILLAYTHEINEQMARETLANNLKKEYRLTRRSSFYTEIKAQ